MYPFLILIIYLLVVWFSFGCVNEPLFTIYPAGRGPGGEWREA